MVYAAPWAPARGYELYVGGYLNLTRLRPLGTNVLDREWDLLVVLDACRVDALRSVAPEYPFLEDVGTTWSVGSTTDEWLVKTFTNRHRDAIAETAYVSANPHVERVFKSGVPVTHPGTRFVVGEWDPVDASTFAHLEEVYTDGWVEDSAVPPRTVTDRAISVARERDPGRLVVHYLQPHRPYLAADRSLDDTWERLYDGELDVETVRAAYEDNLRLVLDDVAVLLSNVDADTAVITADHGEAFGELGKYGHGVAFPHPAVKRVPWVEVTATDEGTYDPGPLADDEDEPPSVAEDRLRELGYL